MKNQRLLSFFKRIPLLILALVCIGAVEQAIPQQFRVPQDPPKAFYKIDSRIDITNGFLKGTETVLFRNSTPRPISAIAVDWIHNDFSPIEVRMKQIPLRLLNPQKGLPNTTPIFYELAPPLKPGAEASLDIEFSMGLGSNLDSIRLTGWHPRLWWEGIPTEDSYRVRLEAPQGYAMAISGRLNAKTGYYENPAVTTRFGIYLAKGMSTAQKTVEDILVTALFTKDREECARYCLEKAAAVLGFCRSWLGFFPFKFLYIIPGGSDPQGGYPYASGIVVIHGQEKFKTMPLFHWEWITAHEIGHQYWGEYVMSGDTPADYTDSWLMIGMGIWADREYTVSKNLSYEKHLGLMKRYLSGVAKRLDTTADAPLSLLKKQNYDRNNILIHGKGFSIISALESILGKGTFDRIYKRCLREYGGRRLGYREFWKVCEDESKENLDWFFEQWVRSTKYLCYQVVSEQSQKEGENYVSHVRLEAPLDSIQMPVSVKAVFEDGTSQVQRTDRFLKTMSLRFESRAKLKEVVLDPENKLAMLKAPLPVLPEDLLETVWRLPWTGAGQEALKAFRAAQEAKLANSDLWFTLSVKLIGGKFYQEAFDALTKVTELKPEKNLSFAALVWMAHLKDLAGEREKAIEYYQQALKYDPGGTAMRHDQWGIVLNRQWVEERIKTPFKWK